MNTGRFLIGLLFSTFIATQAWALPLTSERPWMPSEYSLMFDPGFPVNAVIALSNCSASLIHFKGVSEDLPAVALTNGHCAGAGFFGGMLRPGEIYYQKPQTFKMRLLDRTGKTIANLRADKIIYGTMTNTDLALLEMNQTWRQIRETTGITAMELADIAPAAGTVIQIPSGYWNRTYNCQIENTVHELHEADWVFKKSLRYSPTGCEVVGGTSGSPIVSSVTGEVIAINNTGNESGKRCTLNNPCEVSETGETLVIPGRGYGQQTYELYSCLNAEGRFNLDLPGCLMPHGFQR